MVADFGELVSKARHFDWRDPRQSVRVGLSVCLEVGDNSNVDFSQTHLLEPKISLIGTPKFFLNSVKRGNSRLGL